MSEERLKTLVRYSIVNGMYWTSICFTWWYCNAILVPENRLVRPVDGNAILKKGTLKNNN